MKTKMMTILFLLSLVGGVARADDERGMKFFKKKCANCHKTSDQTLVGPGLKGITQRRDEEWILNWLKSSKKERSSSNDPIVRELLKKYKITMPTIFEFRKQEGLLEDVMMYLKTL